MQGTFFQIADIVVKYCSLQHLRQSGWLNYLISNSITYYQDVCKQMQPTDKSKKKVFKPQFVKDFIIFVCKLIIQFTASEIINDFNQVSQDLLVQFLAQEISLIKVVQLKTDRRLIFVALTDLLLNCTALLN